MHDIRLGTVARNWKGNDSGIPIKPKLAEVLTVLAAASVSLGHATVKNTNKRDNQLFMVVRKLQLVILHVVHFDQDGRIY